MSVNFLSMFGHMGRNVIMDTFAVCICVCACVCVCVCVCVYVYLHVWGYQSADEPQSESGRPECKSRLCYFPAP